MLSRQPNFFRNLGICNLHHNHVIHHNQPPPVQALSTTYSIALYTYYTASASVLSNILTETLNRTTPPLEVLSKHTHWNSTPSPTYYATTGSTLTSILDKSTTPSFTLLCALYQHAATASSNSKQQQAATASSVP